jgi:two-component sensor histidine kinase
MTQEEISGNYYHSLFEESPIPIWEEDFSEIKSHIEALKKKGVTNFEIYFSNNPEQIEVCFNKLVIINVNKAAVELNEAKSKEQLLESYKNFFDHNSKDYIIKQFVAIANNETHCSFEARFVTFNRNVRHVVFRWNVVKGHEKDYGRVFLTTKDLTEKIVTDNLMLQTSNREKEVLLKEVHHRVKNNLQIVTSLLNLQSHSINDPTTKDIFDVSLNRIKSMAAVHEMLYKSSDFSRIEYQSYLRTLVSGLVNSIKGENSEITIKLDAGQLNLNIDTSIPLGLLITELVTNSLKHGIKRDGEIYVYLTRQPDNSLELKIGDNGIGLPDNFSLEDSDTLGLQLVQSLIEQLSGSCRKDKSKKGTHIIIKFREQV